MPGAKESRSSPAPADMRGGAARRGRALANGRATDVAHRACGWPGAERAGKGATTNATVDLHRHASTSRRTIAAMLWAALAQHELSPRTQTRFVTNSFQEKNFEGEAAEKA